MKYHLQPFVNDLISRDEEKKRSPVYDPFHKHFYLTPVQKPPWPKNPNKTSESTHSGHNALLPSFIRFRLYAPPPTPLYLSSPLPLPSAISIPLARDVAGKPIWLSHLCPKDGGGLQRASFWLCRGGRARVCPSQPALIIFRFVWWPSTLFFFWSVCVYVCLYDS